MTCKINDVSAALQRRYAGTLIYYQPQYYKWDVVWFSSAFFSPEVPNFDLSAECLLWEIWRNSTEVNWVALDLQRCK